MLANRIRTCGQTLQLILAACLSGLLLLSCGGGGDESVLVSLPPSTPTVGTDELVFNYADDTDAYEIYAMHLDGSDVRRLTDDPAYDKWWPRISPDSEKILYYQAPYRSPSDPDRQLYQNAALWVMDADGASPIRLRDPGDDGWLIQAHAEWSPDATELVMCGTEDLSVHLFVTDTAGTILRQLTSGDGWNCDPSWSPDGTTIVYNHCDTNGCGSNTPSQLEIRTIAASGTGPPSAPLTGDGLADYDPYYSPDGNTIAWLVNVNPSGWGGGGVWSIRMMNADGSNQRWLINDNQVNSKPSWSLDGGRIYFHRFEPLGAARWRIHALPSDGSSITPAPIDPFGSGNYEYPSN